MPAGYNLSLRWLETASRDGPRPRSARG